MEMSRASKYFKIQDTNSPYIPMKTVQIRYSYTPLQDYFPTMAINILFISVSCWKEMRDNPTLRIKIMFMKLRYKTTKMLIVNFSD